MVYEGEQEGSFNVANILIGKAIRTIFGQHFPISKKRKEGQKDPFSKVVDWFESNNTINLNFDDSDAQYARELNTIYGLAELVDTLEPDSGNMDKYTWMEFVLFGLAEHSKLSRKFYENKTSFTDLLGGYLG